MNTSSISQIHPKKETISETKGKRLFFFNPEHDLALAVGRDTYTPPEKVKTLKNKFSLLPALYADNGDFILISDEVEPSKIPTLDFYSEFLAKNLKLITFRDIPFKADEFSEIFPWGWDYAVRNTLEEAGIDKSLLPDDAFLENVRRLSHRRISISFRQKIAEFLNQSLLFPPEEIFSLGDLEEFLKKFQIAYFKAPWSSSGRGIVVSDHISATGLREWAHGVLKKQGSILAEAAWNRSFDFASEWFVSEGEPIFLGWSVFQTSSRGKYHGNINASQENLIELILANANKLHPETLEAQKEAIRELISPFYNGPLGIDMLADTDGNVNPCVEINLRMTMGHIPILSSNKNKIKL